MDSNNQSILNGTGQKKYKVWHRKNKIRNRRKLYNKNLQTTLRKHLLKSFIELDRKEPIGEKRCAQSDWSTVQMRTQRTTLAMHQSRRLWSRPGGRDRRTTSNNNPNVQSKGGEDTAAETELTNVEEDYKTFNHNKETPGEHKTEEGAIEDMNETRLTEVPSQNRS